MGMVVRTNTMALNAYRQLGMNNNAVTKSLEKLSSGFRINRAGDDAAGLAISEKMKAQITGLETASANAQDGISLIQTAEGNLNEVHSMLNRMVELATKSANGTYTDIERNALQDEVDSLLEEIDRIAQSANFNGTKLLNGSLDQGGKAVSGDFNGILPEVGAPLGDKTYLHGDTTKAAKTEFTISFDTMNANLKANETLEMTIGKGDDKVTLTYTAAADETLTAEDLATAFKAEFDKLTGAAAGTGKINADTFDAEVKDNQLIFTQKAEPTSEDEVVDANLDVAIKYTNAKGEATTLNGDIAVQAVGTLTGEANASIKLDGSDAVAAKFSTQITQNTVLTAGAKISIDGDEYEIVADSATDGQVNLADVNTAAGLASFIASKATAPSGYTLSAEGDNLVYTAEQAGAIGSEGPSATPTGVSVSFKDSSNAPDTSSISIAAIGSTADNGTGVDAVAATKTIDASGLDKDAISTAASAVDANGAITIVKDANSNKLLLKAGDVTIGTSTAEINGAGDITFTLDGDAASTSLGKITITGAAAGSDFATAIETGLTYSAGDLIPPEKETVASTEIKVTGVDLRDTTTKLDATAVQALQDAFKTGEATATLKINDDITIDLAGIAANLTAGTSTATDVANAIKAKAEEAAKAWNEANPDAEYTYENIRISTTNDENGVMPLAAGDGLFVLMDKTPKADPDPAGGTTGVTGNYNAATINNKQGAVEGGGKFASTAFNLSVITDKGSLDGAVLKIGDDEYTFQLGDENKVDGKTIIIDRNTAEDKLLHQAGELLSRVTDNKAFTIGHEGDGKIVLDEKKGNTSYLKELATKSGFESLLSFKTTTAKDSTKGLTLQIGDTAEDFNKMTVSIADMSTKGLDIENLKITSETLASESIDKIKTAINTVSTARAGMGALQNRLEHTINNLDVAVENLSAANSRIRDTDMAKEMMNYTKMNVLVQSAQAMLAQANQQPQSVLQLLQ